MNIDIWESKLAQNISNSIQEWITNYPSTEVVMFAIDCHPWNGVLELAILTHEEYIKDNFLAEPSEMAAWKHYHFSSHFSSWAKVKELSSDMQTTYNSSDAPKETAQKYLKVCASAISSDIVKEQLLNLKKANAFKISVAHPDSDEEYYRS